MHTSRLFVLILALAPMLGACTRQATANQDPIAQARKTGEDARKELAAIEGKLAKLPSACTLGSASHVQGTWITSQHVMSEPVQPTVVVYSLEAPVKASAFRVAFNPNALRALDKIEVREADGNWRPAWSGVQPDAPAACDYVWLQQNVEGRLRPLVALRISFRPTPDKITSSAAGLLQAAPQAGGT